MTAKRKVRKVLSSYFSSAITLFTWKKKPRLAVKKRNAKAKSSLIAATILLALFPSIVNIDIARADSAISISNTSFGSGVATNVGVNLTGFDETKNYQATVKFVDANSIDVTNGTLTATQGGTSLVTGYTSYSAAKLGFKGTYAAVAAALSTITWNPASASGDTSIRIGIVETPGTDEFYDANSGHFYKFFRAGVNTTNALSWTNSRATAEATTKFGLRGYLAEINSLAENTFINKETSIANMWIGATEDALTASTWMGDTYNGTSGQRWIWEGAVQTPLPGGSGTLAQSPSAAFSDWEIGEPNNDNRPGQNCAYIIGNNQGWNDWPCTVRMGYLIEFGGRSGEVSTLVSRTLTTIVRATAVVTLGNFNSNVICTFGLNCSFPISITNPTAKNSSNVDVPGTFTYASSDANKTTVTAVTGGATVDSIGAGTSTITVTFTPTSNLYATATKSFTITVTAGAQSALSITSTSGSMTGLTLTRSGGSGTIAITYAVSNGTATGCAVSAGILTSSTAGTCLVTATNPANGNYASVSSSQTTITLTSNATTITSFNIATPATTGTVDNSARTVALTVPYGTAVTALVPTFVLATGATAKVGATSQTSATTANNFTSAVTYTITAQDGVTTQSYTVTVTIGAQPQQASLSVTSTSGSMNGLTLTSSGGSGTIAITYAVSNGTATGCLITSGILTSTTAGTCSVTATNPANGNYAVVSSSATTVTLAASTITTITSFNFTSLSVTGVVDNSAHTVVLTVPYGTSVTSLVATFVLATGATAKVGATSQTSAATANNFTSAVTYTITAQDGVTTQNYSVTVTFGAQPQQSALSVTSTSGSMNGLTLTSSGGSGTIAITYAVSNGTATGCLITSGILTSTTAGTCSVTATNPANGNYAVVSSSATTVTLAASTITTITSFNFTSPSSTGTVDNTARTVVLTVPYGTAVTALVPNFVLATGATAKVGATSQTSATTANNFTSAVTYTITAQDGVTTQNYSVTVTFGAQPQQASLSVTSTSGSMNGLTLTKTGGSGTIAITYAVSNGTATGCLITSGILTSTTAGTCSVTATNPANGNYAAVSSPQTTITLAASNITTITSFNFTSLSVIGVVDNSAYKVALTVPNGTSVTSLVATFVLATGATATVNSIAQVSAVIENDFTTSVLYTITAQDGLTTKNYTVTVTITPAAVAAPAPAPAPAPRPEPQPEKVVEPTLEANRSAIAPILDKQADPYVTVNGEKITAVVQASSSGSEVKVITPSWTLSLSVEQPGVTAIQPDLTAAQPGGQAVPISSKLVLLLKEGKNVVTSGNGFKPNSEVRVYIFSTPRLIGTTTTDSNGNFMGNFPMLKDIALGDHFIQVNGLSPDNQVRSTTLPAIYEEAKLAVKNLVFVVPFASNKYTLNTSQMAILKSVKQVKAAKIQVIGYAQPFAAQADIALSLDRALEVKKAVSKIVPKANFITRGSGPKKQPLCAAYKNKCVVVTITQG